MDTDSNDKTNCCVDGCPSNLNNNSLCLTQAIEFACENCTNKFCFTHFVDHMKKGEEDPKSNKTSCNSTYNHLCSTGLAIISDKEALVLQPVATSTPIHLIELNSSLKGDIVEDENHLIANNVIEVMDSNMSNQADILISNDVDSKLESTIKEKPYVQKPNQTVGSENSLKENTERLNRSNFYLKNITTSMNYMQVFISIVTKFPLIQLNTTDKSPRIKYLCVADTSISPNEQLVSIQLSFENKVNFKHKFLNNLFPDLKLSDYLLIANGDLFNEEIKSLSQERYIESSVRSSKKQKSSFKDYYREKQQDTASTALKQPSLANAVAVIKDTFPFEYLTFGNQMRGNIEYELQQIEKQKEIEYKPVYDSTSFKIPEEHRNKIKEWLEYDFRMRIEGNITRSRCLFLIGPTQHGI
ncbi:unnamed protein product [Rotaria magnacalcarata]|uniref:Uncharacterized protein n=1 Tax=Rotaria magnacalcarata TaxID=392030 RepID=A0A820CZK3_9BILA|nr:unnamed protein product [Rotaria magnacalcarata]CAF4225662.1 unnamed protein product [Rotaria magnacalcarata]